MNILGYFRSQVPFDIKKGSSWISLFVAFVGLKILEGLLSKLGELLLERMNRFGQYSIPVITDIIKLASEVSIEINVIGIVLLIFLLFPLYRLIDRMILSKFEGKVVFEDKFDGYNGGWNLNFWGSKEPAKTNVVLKEGMVFEADEDLLISEKKQFGAYIDLRDGIFEGNKYKVECWVKSDPNTTMEFRLWLHDTTGGESNSATSFTTPDTNVQRLIKTIKATKTNAVRIHLHCKAGKGRIIVKKVVVKKV